MFNAVWIPITFYRDTHIFPVKEIKHLSSHLNAKRPWNDGVIISVIVSISMILSPPPPPQGLTVDVGGLDVDGSGGQLVGRGQGVVDGGEHLQHPLGQAGLEHHAPAPHAHVLTARVQVGYAHRDYREMDTTQGFDTTIQHKVGSV